MTAPADIATWIVTGNGQRALPELDEALQAAGAQPVALLAEIGIVIVQGTAQQAQAWRALPGVLAVEADQAMGVGDGS